MFLLFVSFNLTFAKAGERNLPWKIKFVMACLRFTFKGDSQTVSNSPLHSCSPTLKPTNELAIGTTYSIDQECTTFPG